MSDDRVPGVREALAEIRHEIQSTRDAVMTKMGGLEVAYRHIVEEVQDTKTIALRAADLATRAQRDAEEAKSRMGTTEDALKQHVDLVAKSAKEDRVTLVVKTDEVLKEIQASRAMGAARSQIRLEDEARKAEEIQTIERRKKHVIFAVTILVSVAQVLQLWRLFQP